MDKVYELFIFGKLQWTGREIVCLCLLFASTAVILYGLYRKNRINLPQSLAAFLMIFFLGMLFSYTIFTRMPERMFQYKLEIFWSWKQVFNGNRYLLAENLLNMILLMPAGALLPVIFQKRLKWWHGLLFGLFLSAVVEVGQLISCRGLFEWDDMIHNSIGCMAACMVSGWVSGKIWSKGRN